MKLKFKEPSKESQNIMSKIANGENDDINYHKIAEDKLKTFTNHNHAKLVNSGNAAILTAMNSIGGAIFVPDQGAWSGFKQIAKFLNKELIIVKTNKGLINNSYLENVLDGNKDKLAMFNDGERSALFLTSFAAYTAEQDIESIANFCHDNDIILVEDASGAITDSKKRLANGNYSDIIIGSTGSPKIINVKDGGFITTNDSSIFEKSRLLLKTCKTSDITASGIATELDLGSNSLNKTINAVNYLKKSLNNVIHENKRGINLIISNNDPKHMSYNLRQEFDLNGQGMITKCPNYNRLKEKAVAIEIKNLAIDCLEKEKLDGIIDIVGKYQ